MRTTKVTAIALGSLLVLTAGLPAAAEDPRTIGEVTALMAEASTAVSAEHATIDGQGGDTDFPYIGRMKALATIGEVDAETGMALTGYPDGQAAWLADEETVRIVYQSESYGSMKNETYPWVMESGVAFTGSHIHTIDYDRAGLADFLGDDTAANEIVRGSGKLFHTIHNVFGDVVVPRGEGGTWGNQTLPDGTVVDFTEPFRLTKGDFFFQSFCGAFYEPANKYGEGIGFADDVWFAAEEGSIQEMFHTTDAEGNVIESVLDTQDTMGMASIVVDIANETAYTVPALGQSGYEKLMPINPGHPDYVVLVLAGYNHRVEPAPLKIYVGRKGLAADGMEIGADAAERDLFLARNGLLHGRIYGLALADETFAGIGIETVDLAEKMMDAYLRDPDAPSTFPAVFAPTSYQWAGWETPVAVRDTEVFRWSDPAEQPEGHTFLLGDSKVEHPAVDPDVTRQRYAQNMTEAGAVLGFDLEGLGAALAELDGALPATVPVQVTRIVAAVDGALTLDIGDKGIGHDGVATHATWMDGTARTVSPDGLAWIKASDADVLILDEDSRNQFGERKMALVIDPATMELKQDGTGHFLAMAGGELNPRAANGVSAYGGTFSRAMGSEFSGTWNLTALLARTADGSFHTADELAGPGQEAINASIPLADQVLLGVVQQPGESGGAVAEVGADQGGQLFLFDLALPL